MKNLNLQKIKFFLDLFATVIDILRDILNNVTNRGEPLSKKMLIDVLTGLVKRGLIGLFIHIVSLWLNLEISVSHVWILSEILCCLYKKVTIIRQLLTHIKKKLNIALRRGRKFLLRLTKKERTITRVMPTDIV